MLPTGQYYTLKIKDITTNAVMFEVNGTEVWLPRTEAPENVSQGEELKVFLYHNSDSEVVATTKKVRACVGDLAVLKVLSVTPHGAFLDWGIAKDLFLPRSVQFDGIEEGDKCLVRVFNDPETGRELAKENLADELDNTILTVKEKEPVELIVYKNTDIGYQVIINDKHVGLMHHNEVFTEYFPGDKLTGFVKKIKEGNKLDVVPGKPGHLKATDESTRILQLLKDNKGFLPYHDKSPAEDIYKTFGISKKTFKMTIGNLYKQKSISISDTGISLL